MLLLRNMVLFGLIALSWDLKWLLLVLWLWIHVVKNISDRLALRSSIDSIQGCWEYETALASLLLVLLEDGE